MSTHALQHDSPVLHRRFTHFENESFQGTPIISHEILVHIFTSLSLQFKSQILNNIMNYIKIPYYLQIKNLKRKAIFGPACVPISFLQDIGG
jgi:hypothetical protein